MSKVLVSVVALVAMALFVGCGAPGGATVVKYQKGGTAMMSEASKDGNYALYSSTDTTPKISYPLKKGDKLGFKEQDGKVWAIAGDKDPIPVETGLMARTYYWKIRTD